MASGKKLFNNLLQADYLKIIEANTTGIKEVFEKQRAKSTVHHFFGYTVLLTIFHCLGTLGPRKFKQLLIKWMVTCDQPFTEVENPEFIVAMSYGRTYSKFTLPKKDGVCRQGMKLGEEVVKETKAMFSVSSLILMHHFLIHSFEICCRPWKEK
jgi:hypothetical protein